MRILVACCFVVGCGGGGGGSGPDAAHDSPAGAACTGAVYDPCTTNDQCMSMNCHFYMQSNFTICTTACSASMPCPNDSSGNPGTCNNMGNCKPAAANNCT